MGFYDARKRAGRGLNETAAYIGVSKQAVNAWELGKSEPSIAAIKKMAEFYNCPIEVLLDGKGKEKKEA